MGAKPTDVFMQFAAWRLTWPGVTTTLVESAKNTGLSVRGGLMWLVHVIELSGFVFGGPDAAFYQFALSTLKGLVVMPTPTDKGYVGGFMSTTNLTVEGRASFLLPWRGAYLPPVPIASPNLSAYMVGSVDTSFLDGNDVHVRIGYTTTPLDAKAYAEIAETWSYV